MLEYKKNCQETPEVSVGRSSPEGPEFRCFISQVEARRNKLVEEMIKQKFMRQTISHKYFQKKEILPLSIKNKTEPSAAIGKRHFINRRTQIYQ